jgi:hypothetical protein
MTYLPTRLWRRAVVKKPPRSVQVPAGKQFERPVLVGSVIA